MTTIHCTEIRCLRVRLHSLQPRGVMQTLSFYGKVRARSPQMHLFREQVHRRLRFLRRLEFINIVLLPGVLVFVCWDSGESWAVRLPALTVVALLLLQGAFYWQAKCRALASGLSSLPIAQALIFEFLKLSDQALLAVLVVYIGVMIAVRSSDPGDLAWGIVLTVFSVLEFVNYFHWQLTHDQASDIRYLFRWRRLRESPLASDLRRVRERLA
jgi:hypothetical protein